MNVTQDLEVEAEAEHQQGTGSQPRAWGMMAAKQTHKRSCSQWFSHNFRCKLNTTIVIIMEGKEKIVSVSQ